MTKFWKTTATNLAVGAVVLFALGQTTALLAGGTYTVVDEKIYDAPIKTQIEQHIVVSGVPTKAELEFELLKRYRAVMARRGFRYHNSATNIFIYIYGTKQQARDGRGLWIGMIAKGFYDRGEPQARISEERLAALSRTPEERFGLPERKRKRVFREIATAEDRATRDAMARVPNSQIMKQIHLEGELREKYNAKVAERHNLTKDQLLKITVEGVKKGWPVR